jgi:hypothetical protein
MAALTLLTKAVDFADGGVDFADEAVYFADGGVDFADEGG